MIKIWTQRKYNNFILRNILVESGWILNIIPRKSKIILKYHTLDAILNRNTSRIKTRMKDDRFAWLYVFFDFHKKIGWKSLIHQWLLNQSPVSLLNSCKIINFATDFQGVCGNKRRKRKTAMYILKDEQRTITIKRINNYGTCYQHRRPAEQTEDRIQSDWI